MERKNRARTDGERSEVGFWFSMTVKDVCQAVVASTDILVFCCIGLRAF